MSYGIIRMVEWRGDHVTPGSLSESEQHRVRVAEAETIRRTGLHPGDVADYYITNDFGRTICVRVWHGETSEEEFIPPQI